MSKRWITVLATALTVLILTGCGANKKAVTEAADGFLTALTNNDKEAAAQFASREFMESDTMLFMEPQHLSDAFYAYMGVDKEELSEEAVKAVDDYVNELVGRAYKSYEIQDVKVQKDQASVTCSITLGYDPDTAVKISEKTEEMIDQYQKDHYDELVDIYIEEGEKAMYKKLYNDLIPIVIGEMHEQIKSGSTSEEKTILTLSKVEKNWIVTAVEEERHSAAEAVSAQEAAAAADTSAENAGTADTSAENAGTDNTAAENADAAFTENAALDETSAEYADADTTEEN